MRRSSRAAFLFIAAGLVTATCSQVPAGGAAGADANAGAGGEGGAGPGGTMATGGAGNGGGGTAEGGVGGVGGEGVGGASGGKGGAVTCPGGAAGTTGSGGGFVGGAGGNQCLQSVEFSPCVGRSCLGDGECVDYQGVCTFGTNPYCGRCGGTDQLCCAGSRCESGGCCVFGYCRAVGAVCLLPNGGGTGTCCAGACSDCGTATHQCCPPSSPTPGCTGVGVICDYRNICGHCGDALEPCCPGNVCNDAATSCQGGMCY